MKKIIFITLLILLGTSFAYAQDDTVGCTMDAMQCPDGSWVGRTGSDCKFVCDSVGGNNPVGINQPPVLGLPDPVLPCRDIYEPVCAIPPMPRCLIEHTCKMPNPVPTTYSNECFAKKAKSKILYEGKCDSKKIDNIKKEIPDNCITWFDGCNTCSRADSGMMRLCTMKACKSYSKPYCMKFKEEKKSDKIDVDITNKKLKEQKVIGDSNGLNINNDLNNEYRIINKTQTKKLFGLFSIKLKTKLFVDKDSGTLIKEKKPWYSFLLF